MTLNLTQENPLPGDAVNAIFCSSAENMAKLPAASVHLMVTSPPYNVGKDYDEDFTLEEYLAFLKRVWQEVERVLVPGGRACINVDNLGRKPYIPLHAYIIRVMVDLGFLMRGEIIWDKGASAAASTAWGSWKSPANPTLRDTHEYILVFSKGRFSRKKPAERDSTISREEFLEYTKSVWTFPAEPARKVGGTVARRRKARLSFPAIRPAGRVAVPSHGGDEQPPGRCGPGPRQEDSA